MKFGSYKIKAKKLSFSERKNGDIIAKVRLEGFIEIGIEIDQWTWRADWIKDYVFKGKTEYNPSDYCVKEVQNNFIQRAYTSSTDVNEVSVLFSKSRW